jgi:hypothetical protein
MSEHKIANQKVETTTGSEPINLGPGTPNLEKDVNGQYKDYWILSKEERLKGFIQPVRTKYIHLKCGCVTVMGLKLSETYARNPIFYGATFCSNCGEHYPVGENGEFVWIEPDGREIGQKVGTFGDKKVNIKINEEPFQLDPVTRAFYLKALADCDGQYQLVKLHNTNPEKDEWFKDQDFVYINEGDAFLTVPPANFS